MVNYVRIIIFLKIHVIQIHVKTTEFAEENQEEVSHVAVQTIAKEVNARFVDQVTFLSFFFS